MDNTLVSARVPKAKKMKAAELLEKRGASMSDLINAAIDNLVDTGELPAVASTGSRPPKQGFREFERRSTLDIEWPSDTPGDYADLEREWRVRDYESLA